MIKTNTHINIAALRARVTPMKIKTLKWSLVKSAKCHKSGQAQIMQLISSRNYVTYVECKNISLNNLCRINRAT
jgi:hypothetical protein